MTNNNHHNVKKEEIHQGSQREYRKDSQNTTSQSSTKKESAGNACKSHVSMSCNITDKVLGEIENKHITPKPRWVFEVWNFIRWSACGVSVAIGSVAVAIFLRFVLETDWSTYPLFYRSLWEHIIMAMPYVWLTTFAVFVFIGYINAHATKSGYRYTLSNMIIAHTGLTLVFGVVLYGIGVPRDLDKALARLVPMYLSQDKQQLTWWQEPDDGLLAGTVINIADDHAHMFEIVDSQGNIWLVRDVRMGMAPEVPVMPGHVVKLVGMEESDGTFTACIIRPYFDDVRWFLHPPKMVKVLSGEILDQQDLEEFHAHMQQHLMEQARAKHEMIERKIEWIRSNGCDMSRYVQ